MTFTRRNLMKAGAAAAVFPTIISRASAQAKQLHVGVYNSAQGKLIQKEVIPKFEAEYKCRVFTTEGATLANIAALRATRDAPRFSVMSMDDVGIPQAKQEGLIDKLDPAKIPNLEKVYKRYIFEDGFGVGFAISSAALFINPQVTKPIQSYEEIFDPKYRKQILLNTPKNTQSILMLIVATALATGKPLKEAQYLVDSGWDKLATLKPNILTIYDSEAQVLQVAQGQAAIGGIEYSKAVYPHTAKGVPLDMTFPKEGSFTGINSITMVKNAPEPELGAAFINRILEPSVAKMLAEQTLSAPSVSGIEFKPEVAKFLAYPDTKATELGLFTPDWNYIVPRRGPWLERYNQLFTS
ncbi:putative spermidine/putrescine transport system substrate-binding protein [Chelatococcus asaccharovorans]|uniref:Putative spermidine/putrescine transport system substrate-binding protein n=2 Tax=Chelatococcus asaccharovorans TaxID=28210 RepID=A0A2V3U4A7_9HYPH|nr:extracellular solute-binding protein [Chelatococcus asaccharovorans]PXW57082.1 putative spermidine/putrescine transport system substrate-binding protein [Chelatococcus asaccharovorans]CAH1672855.1 putative spermidine/putrescine transport system substrate-binding protein [Chelatococcus asaccharovorans]CAH1675753.1 putative spermidine/putrescine transport system substrate-binding protein [Chelatococcus asaccharovorans]